MEHPPLSKGVVYLVGAGPGDAGLITVKGLRCLQEADVVVYDRSAGPRLMQYAKRGSRKIYVGKLPDRHAMKQEDINRLLVELALEGHAVTRLKGGDPCVFGCVGEEATSLAEHGIRYEIVPGVCRERLQWAESRPLFGRRVLVTRARDQASELTRRIEDAGGEPYEYPVIELRMPESPASREALCQALARPDAYDWLVLTSVNGIRFWFRHLRKHGADIRQWAHVRIVSVGPKTTEALREYGIQPDIAASQFSQEGIWEALRSHAAAGQRVLLARGDLSRSWLRETMEAHGLYADEVDLYETVLPEEDDPELIRLLQQQMIHIVTFTSSSTVTNLMAALRRMGMDDPAQALQGASIACIGENTARTVREAGLHVDVTAASSTIDGLMDAMLELGKREKT
ncbi:uroporphyrinogen-III synthase [Paenibacillus popilliae]|uniref:uroporphyrinogen-III C-methyltransferase n=1 Tax=Paenibacillus popilliae ATCC 14706 TaxID=1212764 RepID=M9L8B7_PAEPP|nr:uroporphyrinogen-III synthase [Paenibacillus popilliae]GAC41402.1 uroporphyrinogen-III methylase [Paenibacillus popilliae ATCC 14706]